MSKYLILQEWIVGPTICTYTLPNVGELLYIHKLAKNRCYIQFTYEFKRIFPQPWINYTTYDTLNQAKDFIKNELKGVGYSILTQEYSVYE